MCQKMLSQPETTKTISGKMEFKRVQSKKELMNTHISLFYSYIHWMSRKECLQNISI